MPSGTGGSKKKKAAAKPGDRFGAANNYEGKQHYPRHVHRLDENGVLHSKEVTKEQHDYLDKHEPGVWKKQIVDLGIETAPAKKDEDAPAVKPAKGARSRKGTSTKSAKKGRK